MSPRRELDLRHMTKIYLERKEEHFFLYAGRKGVNLVKGSYFLTKYLNIEQFRSLEIKERQSREIYFGFKYIAISRYF